MNAARRLTADDAPSLYALRLRALRDHPLDFGAAYEEEAAWGAKAWAARMMSTHWFGVEAGGALIACASLRIPDRIRLKHNGWINAMFVAREAQGAGAAHALMEEIEAFARRAGVSILKLNVRAGNSRAEAFYLRRGFEPFGLEPDSMIVDGVGHASVEMAKRL